MFQKHFILCLLYPCYYRFKKFMISHVKIYFNYITLVIYIHQNRDYIFIHIEAQSEAIKLFVTFLISDKFLIWKLWHFMMVIFFMFIWIPSFPGIWAGPIWVGLSVLMCWLQLVVVLIISLLGPGSVIHLGEKPAQPRRGVKSLIVATLWIITNEGCDQLCLFGIKNMVLDFHWAIYIHTKMAFICVACTYDPWTYILWSRGSFDPWTLTVLCTFEEIQKYICIIHHFSVLRWHR